MIKSQNQEKTGSTVSGFLIFCICIIVCGIVAVDSNQPEYYQYLGLLPICFCVLSWIFIRLYDEIQNVGILAILGLEAFRLVVTPLIMFLGDYNSVMKLHIAQNASQAIALMIYEAIVVFIVVAYANKKTGSVVSRQRKVRKTNLLNKLLVAMLVFLVFVYVAYPNSVTGFKTIFDITQDDFTSWSELGADRHEAGTMTRILTTLFTIVFTWVRYLLPIAIIIWCRRHIKNNFVAILLSIIPIALQMLFITATIMDGILCAFVLMIVLGKCYPRKRKYLFVVSVVLFLSAIVYYFLVRSVVKGETNIWQYLSENAIAYCGGIDNVAAMMNVDPSYRSSTFFFNIYGAIPFNSTLFGLHGDKLAAVFNLANNSVEGHIPPTIGAGYYYYGWLFAPIESAVFAYIATKYGNKAKYEKNIWRYMIYVLVALMMAMGFTTYNAAIVLNYVTTMLIPLLVLCSLTDDRIFDIGGLELRK